MALGSRWPAARGSLVLASSLAVALLSCAELPTIPEDICGNGIIDPNEDCDGAPLDAHPGNACGKKHDGEVACRMLCGDAAPDGSNRDCPAGWGCGRDHICRLWTGQFDGTGTFEADVRQLAVADFDGDLHEDVLAIGFSQLAIHYFDEASQITQTTRIGAPDQAPAVGDLNNDKKADLALTLGAGVGVLLGAEDRKLEPVVYTAYTGKLAAGRVFAAEALPEEQGDEILAVQTDGVGLYEEGESFATVVAGQVEKFETSRPVAVADLVPDEPCDEIVVQELGALEGAPDRLLVVNPCSALPNKLIAAIAPGKPIVSPVQVLDLNRDNGSGPDGDLDLAFAVLSVDAEQGQAYQLMVVYGPDFDLATSRCTHATISKTLVDQFCPVSIAPLAVGDLDGDNILDAIEPCAIHLSRWGDQAGAPPVCPGSEEELPRDIEPWAFNGGTPWSSAVLRDLNGDGDPDAIMTSAGSSGLTFLGGTKEGVLNETVIPTLRNVEEIVVGEFDGDQVPDIAVREVEVDGGHPISIAFGRHGSIPEPPIEISRVPAAEQLFVADLRAASLALDAIDDLVVVRRVDSQRIDMSVFAGSSARLMQSTFWLREGNQGGQRGPRRVAIGKFAGTGPERWLGVVASNASQVGTELWHARISPGDATLLPVTPGDPPNPLRFAPTAGPDSRFDLSVSFSSRVGAVKRGSGDDELFVAGRTDAGMAVLMAAAPCSGGTCPITWDGSGVSIHSIDQIEIADIGAPGSQDVAVLLQGFDPNMSPDLPSKPVGSWIEVLWNGAGEDFATTTTAIDLAAIDVDPEPITAFVWIDLDEDPEREAIVLTRATAYRVDLSDDGGVVPEPALSGGTAIAAGDINADGITDLVIGDEGRFSVFVGVPANPADRP